MYRSAEMARLTLALLGGFQLRSESRALALPAKKAQALLAYLALRAGRPHSREMLMTLLWGETEDRQARQSLRQSVFLLRKVFATARNAGLVIHGGTIAIDRSAVDVDVARFERLVRKGTRAALEAAVDLYQGPFLDGLRVDAGPFEEWLQSERERLRELAVDALSALLSIQTARGPAHAATDTAAQLLALDPLRESGHRALMRLYLRQGHRAAALRQYEVCLGLLERELGVEPEAETQRLYRTILQARAPAASPVRGTIATTETPLVGRDQELRQLRLLMRAALDGRGRSALVTGEAGIGKSRLVEELAGSGSGTRVLLGHAYETEQVLPFQPWADAFRTARVLTEADVRRELNPFATRELARLFPELAEAGASAMISPQHHVRLFEAVDTLVGRLAARQPLLIVMEDLHWADDLSLRLFAFLGRRIAARPVLLLGTARDEELSDAPALRHILGELQLEGRADRLSLTPLSESSTGRLVRALARTGSHDRSVGGLADHVWAVSEGNPFVVVETMRALRDGGAMARTAATLPDRVREMTLARVERLGPKARQLVAVASVLEREFEFAVLQHAGGLGRRETAEGLEELVRRRILDAVGERFAFTHVRVRKAVYDDLLAPRRAALHAAVGEALEAVYAGRLHEIHDRLAYHFSNGDEPARAFAHLIAVADSAARRYALDDALTVLRDALRQVDRLPAADRDRRHLDLVFRLAHTLTLLGRAREADALLDEHESRAERIGDASVAGLHAFWRAYTHGNLGDVEHAMASARRALEEAARAGDAATMGKASFVLSRECYMRARPLEGITHGRQAVALLERTDEAWWLGQAHRALAMNLVHIGDFDEALIALEQVCRVGEASGDSGLHALGALTVGWVRALTGDYVGGMASCRQAVELALDPVTRAFALGTLGAIHREHEDPVEAIPLLERGITELERLGGTGGYRYRQVDAFLTASLSEAYLLRGDVERAGTLARKALGAAAEGGWDVAVGYAERAMGRVAQATGDLAGAHDHATRALDVFSSTDARFQVARTRLLLAEVCRARGEDSAASAHLQEAVDAFRRLRVPRHAERAHRLAQQLGLGDVARSPG